MIDASLTLLVLISMTVALFLRGTRYRTSAIALSFPAVVAPVVTLSTMPGQLEYPVTWQMLILYTASLVLPLIAIPVKREPPPARESALRDSRGVRTLLIAGTSIAALFSVYMTYALVAQYSVSSLNELNLVYSDPDLPEFGLIGRIGRLSMPLGLVSLVIWLETPRRNRRAFYLVIALLALVTLIGVRRSTFFYQVAFYLFLWLNQRARHGRLLRSGVLASGVIAGMLTFFGFVQVATNKASADLDSLTAGLEGASIYIGGNMPYSETLLANPESVERGFSFPIISYFISDVAGAERKDLGKPFFPLPDGVLFNTSPAYTDVLIDFGTVGVILFGLALGTLLLLGIAGSNRWEGLHAVMLTIVAFSMRENMLGMLDVVQTIVVYPFLVYLLTRIARESKQSPGHRAVRPNIAEIPR